ncbi:hypothetical protein GCM10010191_23860 [Actinomadura vinacea]|uniref:DUF4440 domain-containing protein n=1 Tax=Actinomadura vinacea TaxID=115336 RepID=A0ABP5VW58_9ACTN
MSAVDEIVQHHRFIESWLRGEENPSDVSAFLDRHTPDFTWYDPDGSSADRTALADVMTKAHGSAPGLVLEIRAPRVLLDRDGLVVATYEEHQRTPGSSTARRAVAIFVPEAGARNGLRWRHLHETWIHDAAPA